jgi:hypothetical protein
MRKLIPCMKKYLTAFVLVTLTQICSAQISQFGVSVAGASSGTMMIDVLAGGDVNRFHLGASIQFGGQKGQQVDERGQTYGLTQDGSGEYFITVDLGYSRVIKEKFTINPELSIGNNRHYTNYIDRRFNSDHYHLVTKKEAVFGVGVNAGYIISPNFEVFGGFNSNRGVAIGARLILHTM